MIYALYTIYMIYELYTIYMIYDIYIYMICIYIILIGGFKGLNSKVSPMDPQVTFALFGGKETEAVPGRSGAVCLKTNGRRVGKSWENYSGIIVR